jgi:hypothetical protein
VEIKRAVIRNAARGERVLLAALLASATSLMPVLSRMAEAAPGHSPKICYVSTITRLLPDGRVEESLDPRPNAETNPNPLEECPNGATSIMSTRQFIEYQKTFYPGGISGGPAYLPGDTGSEHVLTFRYYPATQR